MKRSLEGFWNGCRRLGELARALGRELRRALRRGVARLRAVDWPQQAELAAARLRELRRRPWFVPASAILVLGYCVRLELSLSELGGNVGDDGRLAALSRDARGTALEAVELARAADQRSRELRLASDDVVSSSRRAQERATDAFADADLAAAQAAAAEAVAHAARDEAATAGERASAAERLAAMAVEDAGGAVQSSRQARAQAVEAGQVAQVALYRAVPPGTIVPWDPVLRDARGNPRGQRSLPEGWAVCDGSHGTPNLAHRFLRGVGVPALAGEYGEPSRMGAAGFHSHAVDPMVNSFQWFKNRLQGVRKNRGDGLVLLDKGFGDQLDEHGVHTHEDENVPAHYKVVYIMKLDGEGELQPTFAASLVEAAAPNEDG